MRSFFGGRRPKIKLLGASLGSKQVALGQRFPLEGLPKARASEYLDSGLVSRDICVGVLDIFGVLWLGHLWSC